MLEFDGIQFEWTGHDGFRIAADNKTIYIDPFRLGHKYQHKNDADIVLITHSHFDHLSVEDLRHIISDRTTVVAAVECEGKLGNLKPKVQKSLQPGDNAMIDGVAVEAMPAYNTNKKFHPKGDLKVGFVVDFASNRIYHTGDTDEIPEMNATKPDIALVPVSGTYVMTAEEAAHAVNEKIKPKKLAIPMHYGSIVGSLNDAMQFKDLVTVCNVRILDQD